MSKDTRATHRRQRLFLNTLPLFPAGLPLRRESVEGSTEINQLALISPRSTGGASPIAEEESQQKDEYWGEWKGRRTRIAGVGSWPCDSIELERHEAQVSTRQGQAEGGALVIENTQVRGYEAVEGLMSSTGLSVDQIGGLRADPFLGPVYDVLRSPRQSPRILDIATGTGIWAIDMAELFPYVEVIGIDNVPMQQPMVPGNCEFEIVDLETYPLPYDPVSFNLIHLRFAHLRVRNFSHLLREAIRLLRPGGLLLIFDASSTPTLSDGVVPTGVQGWSDAFSRGLKVTGMRPFDLQQVLVEDALEGMEVRGDHMRVPIGHGTGRMGQLGKIHMINTQAYLEAARHVMMEYGEYTEAEVNVLSAAYMSDVEKQPMYTQYHALSIRKPE